MNNIPRCTREMKDVMWKNIESRINPIKENFLLRSWGYIRTMSKPAYIGLATLSAVILLVFFMSTTSTTSQDDLEEFSELYAYSDYEDMDFGTAVEEFLF
jgi:hypothetical protein